MSGSHAWLVHPGIDIVVEAQYARGTVDLPVGKIDGNIWTGAGGSPLLDWIARRRQIARSLSRGIDGTLASGNQMTKRILQNFVVGWALVGVALGTIACPDKGPAEKAGEKVDDAVDKAKDAVK